jgi:CheY-like chemotaxis protein
MQRESLMAEIVSQGVFGSLPEGSSHLISPQPWTKRRLLWVDDSRVLLSLYKSVFESLGFEVVASSSPEEALGLLSSDVIDIAILDYDMPEMNGGVLASLIKDQFPALPIILYTGSTYIPCSAHGAVDGVCDKAAPREELLAMIERLSRESSRQPSFPAEHAAAQQA